MQMHDVRLFFPDHIDRFLGRQITSAVHYPGNSVSKRLKLHIYITGDFDAFIGRFSAVSVKDDRIDAQSVIAALQ